MTKYGSILPIQSPISADRQNAKRHYGVHPYFTRRPYNVVRDYIVHYSKEGDWVLDPFGGSGVTAIEAFLENRVGIQNDINPLANFIAKGIANLQKGEISVYETALKALREQCEDELERLYRISDVEVESFLKTLKMPDEVQLPKSSDVRKYSELFSRRQIAALAFLRKAVDVIRDVHARQGMLVAWSATLAKLNRTFLSAEGRAESRGGSSIFSIYRYKVAKDPVELPPWKVFVERAQNVIAAKAEIDKAVELKRRTTGWSGEFQVKAADIEDLSEQFKGKVDYIFTDAPYGGHISYLDLSTLWNNWLGKMPSPETRRRELIVGGDLGLEEEAYTKRLGKSIRDCLKMLKRDRWLSVVFQHWNTAYFEAILSAAAENGADLRAAVPQVGDTIWSMHKKKGNESVLAGELILTFFKTGVLKKNRAQDSNFDIQRTMAEILVHANEQVMYGEHLFNQLVLAAWNQGAIGSFQLSKDDFNELIKQHGWQYDEEKHYWVKGHFDDLLFRPNL